MKKVLVVAPQPFFTNRGTPMNVREMVVRMTELSFEVHLLVFPHGRDVVLPNVKIFRTWKIPFVRDVPIGPSWRKVVYDVLLFFHALVLSTRYRYAVLHGIEEGAFIAGVLGLLRRVPFVVDMDSCLVTQTESSSFGRYPFATRLLSAFERFFIKRATAVVTVCADLTEKVRAIHPEGPVFQIEDFPLEGSEVVDAQLVDSIRSTLPDRAVFLYTGNLEKYQGIDLLLASFSRLKRKERGDAAALLVVGGSEHDIAHYKQLAADLGIADDVHFHGPRPPQEMGSYMAAATALVSPRVVGGNTPLKLYTYMASGVPVVATTIKAHSQVLDERCAFLASPTADDFAEAMHFCLRADPQERQARAQVAQALVSSRYSRARFQQSMTELYAFVSGDAALLGRLDSGDAVKDPSWMPSHLQRVRAKR